MPVVVDLDELEDGDPSRIARQEVYVVDEPPNSRVRRVATSVIDATHGGETLASTGVERYVDRMRVAVLTGFTLLIVFSCASEPRDVDDDGSADGSGAATMTGNGGSESGGGGAGGSGGMDRAACDAYIACIGAAQPENLPTVLDGFGVNGTCYRDATPEYCEQACQEALNALKVAYPDVPECAGEASGCTSNGSPKAIAGDCQGACEILFCCATGPACAGVTTADEAGFVTRCAADCAANMAMIAVIDGDDCDATIGTLRSVSATFADTCDNGP